MTPDSTATRLIAVKAQARIKSHGWTLQISVEHVNERDDVCRAEKMRTERALRDAKDRLGKTVKEVTDKTGQVMQLQAAAASHADELRVVRASLALPWPS